MNNFYKGKKVFITGHTGFKGSWLCKILLLMGADVTGYALEPLEQSMFQLLDLSKQMKSIIGDIRDLKKLQKAVNDCKPDIIFHLAAQPIVLKSYENPVYTYDVNVMGTVNILECVRLCPSIKSFINVTTDKVYYNDDSGRYFKESDKLCGNDPYSNSKSCSELVTYSYNKSFFDDKKDLSISTVRSGNVIGGGDFASYRIVPDCVKSALKKETIIVRNPNSVRPYLHVMESLNGYLTLAMLQYDNKKLSGNYNFAPENDKCITTEDLVNIFVKYWEGASWKCITKNGPYEDKFLKLDASKAKKFLNWQAKLSIEDAVKLVVEWNKEYAKNNNLNTITEKQIRNYFAMEEY